MGLFVRPREGSPEVHDLNGVRSRHKIKEIEYESGTEVVIYVFKMYDEL